MGLALLIGPTLSKSNLQTASHGVVLGVIMLSLVLLIGYGGQVSLCQMTFAGLGAFAMGQVANGASWWGVLAAVGLAAAVGAIIALRRCACAGSTWRWRPSRSRRPWIPGSS